ncbi:substrate-binding and VWA domain-containing protein [Kutzneria viridogrisea]|uniref:von Willebrand factor type A n=1 Tax=Kutzneria albida DSM 43870 TaxID=1449976 RepID=W5W775_9PSEU|nr:von Willebrand factor type A [Kutzneria albida DSM 43870]
MVVAALAVVVIVVLRMVTAGPPSPDAAQAKCSGSGVRLAVTSSPEKAGLLKQVASDYSGRTVAGQCAQVVVTSANSGATMAALAKGWNEAVDGPKPDVWTPAATAWLTLLRQRSTQDHTVLAEGTPQSVINAPLVFAMPKPMAQALGWPDKQISWKDLAALAGDPQGWARYGHPEWGAFRLGKTNPNLSTSGLNATVGAYRAATGTTSDLTEADLATAGVQSFVRTVEQSIVHYGDTTLTFLANLQQADDRGAAMSYISAVTVEENSVLDYNLGNPSGDPATAGKHAKPKVPLVAVYPADGTLVSDHPYAELSGLDPAKKAVAEDFLNYLHTDAAQSRFTDHGFRNWHDEPGPQATRENGILGDAKLSVLKPPGPQVMDKLLASWATLRKASNVLLVVDTSGSMGEQVNGTGKSKMDLAKNAATTALGQFGDKDKVGLWMFATNYRELVPVGLVGDQRDTLKSRLDGLIPQGGTGLYDTTASAYDYVKAHLDPNAINAVVVLTDGRNEKDGGRDLNTLLGQLHSEDANAPVRVFTIAYGADADQDVLRRIAQTTSAAEYDSSDPGGIDAVFTAVISNF